VSAADKIAASYQRLEAGHHAGLRLFLQHAYRLGLVLAHDKRQFRRLQDSEFCRASGQKLTPRNIMRSTLFYVMRATSPQLRGRAGKYAKVLALFHEQVVPPADIAQLIEDLGGVEKILRMLSGRESCEVGNGREGGDVPATIEPDGFADDAGSKQNAAPGDSNQAINLRNQCLSAIAEKAASRPKTIASAPRRLEDNVVLSEGIFVKMRPEKLRGFLAIGNCIQVPIRATLSLVVYPRDDSGWMAAVADNFIVSPSDLAMASEPDDEDFDLGESATEDAGDFALLK